MEDSTRAQVVEQTLAAVQPELWALVDWLVAHRETDLRTLEAGLVDRGHQVLCRLLATVLGNSPAAVSRAERSCPQCRQPLSDLGRRPKVLHLTLGDVELRRVCGYCPRCHRTDARLDAQLGLDQSGRSPRLVEMVALLGAELPFVPAAMRLAQLCGVTVSASQLQQVTEGIGRTRAQQEQAVVEVAWATGVLPAVEQRPDWLVVALDGVMVAEREGYHEVRCGALAGATRPPGAGMEPIVGDWRYVVTPEDVPTFGRLVSLEAHRQGLATATQVVVLGDGAAWIWNLARDYFPHAVQILDLWHARQHLWAAGRACFGEGDDRVAAWVATSTARLLAGDVQALLAEWTQVDPHDRSAWAAEQTYFHNQAHRMAYDQYRAAGYPLGSGAVESANRHVIGVRVKQAGMHWRRPGLTGVLALRTLLRSQRWDAWWQAQPLPIPLAA